MFTTLLVANRGEIALRIIRAARGAGLRTVAVYSDADRDAPHVRAADVAARLGPAPAEESYLSVRAILDAARRTGAEAVHPGYGFLSENAAFARACEDAGLVFVGPPSAVVETMGRKDAARRIALAAGVPVVPAVEGADDATLAAAATAEIGLPVLVKAAAGGGGKGMRVVREESALPAALAAARRESAAAFGDDTLLVERYVERGRHIEVQVLADTHGSVVHLHERDCSVQRRHQKVVEEAPARAISPAVRALVTDGAVRLAREVGYVGAGTVEFLVAGEEAWLLEMNTRLQVEHPVTEAVTGLDLVALQLAVAQGDPLPITQADVRVSGHAIEARVYAEDPAQGFLPQAGTAVTVRWPTRARVDAALEDGQTVGTWYDPLLAKIITHGPTREAARAAMVAALDDTAVLGLTTNTGFLRRLVDSAEYRDATIDTAWLDRTPGAFPPPPAELPLLAAAFALARAGTDQPDHPFGTVDGWRLGGPPAPVVVALEHAGERHTAHVHLDGVIRVGEKAWTLRETASRPGETALEIDAMVHRFVIRTGGAGAVVAHHGESYTFTVPDRLGADHAVVSDGLVTAPMPGLVRDVGVRPGQPVSAGDVLGVLEAMKMETALTAPHDGVVETVQVSAGDQVALGQPLFGIAAREEA
ncbi:acetyl/propionyl/methylcrotonyl-CoA carboxylase subunit alpha [Georgenia subflava]|uniref:Biotin-dependent 3-methylcrotonyl-coenzyme A carboxylase alpha1 subunit n=1 Tax=Georgenia subflava TaxID=1622177 RepID=A0A6N7EEY7_9MICO|nr:biotin carboxylase N-terminal domain-containing protein [Georgenia subflava]MPV35743.1 ATP-grasp domain-containing protein [Georgenia subflava]